MTNNLALLSLLFVAVSLVAVPGFAQNYNFHSGSRGSSGHYISSYSGGSGYTQLWRGGGNRLVTLGGYGVGNVSRPHRSAWEQHQQQLAQLEAMRAIKYSRPPCGIYNRMPRRCKKVK